MGSNMTTSLSFTTGALIVTNYKDGVPTDQCDGDLEKFRAAMEGGGAGELEEELSMGGGKSPAAATGQIKKAKARAATRTAQKEKVALQVTEGD